MIKKKISRKKPFTPRSQIRSALRKLWLRSRERAECLKLDKYSCRACGGKQSKAIGREFAVEVHHQNGIESWEKIIDLIQSELLCHPEDLITLCHTCHDKLHKNEKEK
jgi:predicted HNH restriction endonuclease